jgi:hypothetical protein
MVFSKLKTKTLQIEKLTDGQPNNSCGLIVDIVLCKDQGENL